MPNMFGDEVMTDKACVRLPLCSNCNPLTYAHKLPLLFDSLYDGIFPHVDKV